MTYTLGVDLGTTFSAAAIDDGSGPSPLRLGSASDAMPSVVAVKGGEPVTGEAAEEILRTTPSAGVRETKRRFGDSTPLIVDGTPFGAEALMGLLLADVIRAATKERGEAPSSVVLSHPANWGEYKKDLLSDTARVAGLEDVGLITEPQAAAVHYVRSGELEVGRTAGVYDFGGGTFDAAVVRCAEDGPELLGEAKGLERLGGIDLDQAILMHVNESIDGALRELDASDPAVVAAMAAVRSQCVAAKEALSTAGEATIRVDLPGFNTEVRLTRTEFEAMLRPRIVDTLKQLDEALRSAGVSPGDLTAVLLVGGMSRIPLVGEMVAAHTGAKVVATADQKTVVCAGASAADSPVLSADAVESTGAYVVTGPKGEARKYRGGVSKRRLALIGGASVLAVGGAVAGAVAFGVSPAAAMGAVGDALNLSGDDGAPGGDRADAGKGMKASEMDSFEDLADPGPAYGGGGGAAAPAGAVAAGPAVLGATPMARAASVSQRGSSAISTPTQPAVTEAESTTTTPLDLEFLKTKAELLESVNKWQPPGGVDPKAAGEFRAELLDRIERFQPMPGESTEHALAAMKDEFQDQVKDFVQDQKIEDFLIEQAAEDAAAAAVDAELSAAKEKLLAGLEKYQPPTGVDADDYAAMRTDVEALISRYQPVPGQTAEEALAELRYQYENRVHEVAQDMKIEGVAEDLTRDPWQDPHTTVQDEGTTIKYGPPYPDRATNPPQPNVTDNGDGTQTVTFVNEQGRQVVITTTERSEVAFEKYQRHNPLPPPPPTSTTTLPPDAYTTTLVDVLPEDEPRAAAAADAPLAEAEPTPAAPESVATPAPVNASVDEAEDSVVGDDFDADADLSEFGGWEATEDGGEKGPVADREFDLERQWPDELAEPEPEPADALAGEDDFGDTGDAVFGGDDDASDAFATGGDESADEFDVTN